MNEAEALQQRRCNRRNFWTLSAYSVCERVAWVFKTETVIMPAFLDAVGGTATARGLLPILSRLGSSVPQYLLAPQLQGARRLGPVLALASFAQAVPWLLLSVFCWSGSATGVTWILGFLAAYAGFWIANGMVLLAQGLLQGKLVPASFRGRLLAVSNFLGCGAGIAAIFIWMIPTLRTADGASGFTSVFIATGTFFTLSAAFCMFLSEPEAVREPSHAGWKDFLRSSLELLQSNADYRRLTVVITLHYMLLVLFPHFGSFGTQRLGLDAVDMSIWIIVQNVGTALGSAFWGPVADRRGNRLVLRLLLAWLAMAPLCAVLFAEIAPGIGRGLYWIVFAILGFTPVSQRIYVNYLLELAPDNEHPQYLGTFHLWQCVPLVFSPLVGWLIDVTSYRVVFMLGSATVFCAAWLAGRLTEPRESVTPIFPGRATSLQE